MISDQHIDDLKRRLKEAQRGLNEAHLALMFAEAKKKTAESTCRDIQNRLYAAELLNSEHSQADATIHLTREGQEGSHHG